jgi:hypothetical protein
MREKTDALQQVIYDQRELLTRYVNSDAGKIPQQFVPYKEVLDIYENGLDVPNDIMLTWCDDNYGYLTRLSDSVQQQRSGGAGVYYHLSYWGRPHDYLWLTTTQPGLIYHEMKNAFAHHARRLWIANVHDVKPAAYDLELFLDLAWNINAVTNVSAHLQRWLCRDFGLDAGEKLFPAMHDFYRLTAIRKPEFMGWNQVELDKTVYPRGWSPVASTEFGAETAQYLQNYENSKQIILDVEKIIPPNRQDAFFAAIKYPVLCAAAMAAKWLEYQQGNYSASLKAYSEIVELTGYYNNTMSGGKWKNSMSASPRNLHVFDRPNTDAPSASSQPETERMNTGQHVIARNASNFSSADADAHPVQMLGHSMNAVALPKGSSLVYEFETEQAGMAVLRTAVIPTHPNDKGDIRFSVQIDDENPQVISFCEKGRTEQWKQHVLRGQAVKTTKHTLAKGLHTLTVTALDNHVVIDQWMIDFDMDRKFYLFPVK